MTLSGGLTKSQSLLILDSVEEIMLSLGLSEWHARVQREFLENDADVLEDEAAAFEAKKAMAAVFPVPGRKVFTLKLSRDFLELRRREQQRTLLHEVLHLCFKEAEEVWRTCNERSLMSQTTYDALWTSFSDRVETAVDQLAWALYKVLPVPESLKQLPEGDGFC